MYVPWQESDEQFSGSFVTRINLVDKEDTVYVYEMETNVKAAPTDECLNQASCEDEAEEEGQDNEEAPEKDDGEVPVPEKDEEQEVIKDKEVQPKKKKVTKEDD